MIDSNYIPLGYKQEGNVCLLASYTVCLGFYKKLENGLEAQIRFKYIIDKYVDFIKRKSEEHNSNELREIISTVENLRSRGRSRKDVEESISNMLHYYCHDIRGDIRGYVHIKEFNDYIRINNNIGLPTNFDCDLMYAQNDPIEGVQNIILQNLLEQNSLAMIFYNNHSVVIGKGENNTIFLRDTNCDDIEVIQEESFNSELFPISEYIRFRQTNN